MKGFVHLVNLIALGTLFVPIPNEFRNSPPEPVLIQFHETVWEIPEACNLTVPEGKVIYGCYVPTTKTTHVPNPCYYPEAENIGSFAYLLCHEKGHVNGWRH
jgi:hypothetical protein